MKKISVIFACVVAVICIALVLGLANLPSGIQPQDQLRIERTAIVERVVDGDTLQLQGGEKIRLVGVNTPEIGSNAEPGGVEAKEFMEGLCPPGTEIGLDVDDLDPNDKYDRTLAVVYIDVDGAWVNVNAELLRMGYAEVMFIPPSEFNPYQWQVSRAFQQ